MIELKITGIPDGQKRPRVYFKHGKTIAHSPKSSWYNIVYSQALENKPTILIDNPINLKVIFYFPRPKSVKKDQIFKISRPDTDNCLKSVMDALTHAGWWSDDSRVVQLYSEKRYVDQNNTTPGAAITLTEATRE